MATRRTRLLASAALAIAGAGGYFLYSVFAAQAQGELTQAPLNVQAQTPAAFIMAVDDSNSMTFERIFPGGDGRMQWNSSNKSFFSSGGSFYSIGATCQTNSTDCYLYLFPHKGFNSSYSPGAAIPPFDSQGFARSPAYNKGYFDPSVTYKPWTNADGSAWPAANPKSTRADPRSGGSFATAYSVVYDLTADRQDTGDGVFRIPKGMTIPKGTTYRTNGRTCNSNNSNGLASTSNKWSTLANAVEAQAACGVQIGYFPATFYLPAAQAAPPGYRTGNDYRPIISGACGPGCDLRRYQIKPGNYESTAAYNEALQNFANWFQYHRSRLLAMVGAMTEAMKPVNDMRIGYFTINNQVNVTMHDMGSTGKAALYDQMTKLQAGLLAFGSGGGTPNRTAVKWLGDQFRRTGNNVPVQYACQKNAGMLFTDGYTNSGNTVSGYGNADNGWGAPFADGYSNTIADIAASFYNGSNVPLRSGNGFPAGMVKVPEACSTLNTNSAEWKRLDCQRDLHMNFYGVTLGARGRIYDVNAAATADPFTSAPNWNSLPDPSGVDDGTVIDEIWHAALNSRGRFINANTPADISQALRQVLQAVGGGGSSSGSIAMTGARIGSRSLSVVPGYAVAREGTDWSGTLEVSKVSAELATGEVSDTPLWEASARLAELSPAQRRTRTWVGTAAGTELLGAVTDLNRFCNNPRTGMSRCTAAEISALGINASQAIDYFLGDTSREIRNGGTLRDRSTILGDIINSTPVVSAPTDDYGYRSLGTPYGTSYATYMTAKQSRPAMVYVGANDGMLHAFHGGIDYQGTVSASNKGVQQFAYIPRAVLGHMGNLLFPYNPSSVGQKFDHRYYVDGPLSVGDAYYGGGWKTVLVGTTGAGGRSVFALNISNPSTFSRLWEIDDQHVNPDVRDNIGHVLGKPVIVPFRTAAGQVSWRAIFGNGYNSANGVAVLFVVDIDSGAVRMIRATESAAPPGSNGLGNIVVVDRRDSDSGLEVQDGYADTVYAADRKGAIWKFDLLDNATTISRPLFTTMTHTGAGGVTYRQPITGGLVATAGSGGGVMLLFGTGSFSFQGDATDSSIQSIYGVQDRGAATTLTRANLFGRSIVTYGNSTRTITSGTMSYGASGWYLDLPAGERMVGYPRVASGVLFVPTYAPSTADGCSAGGENWLYGLDTRSGAPGLSGVRFGNITGQSQGAAVGAVIIPTDGSAPVKDVGVSVLSTSTPIDPSLPRCWMRVSVPGMTQAMYVPYPCGRQSWRQIE